MDSTELSLFLSRRQKRLAFWKQNLLSPDTPENQRIELEDLFETYTLLLSKITQTRDDSELEETKLRLNTLERNFTSALESRRLLTEKLGIPAVEA